MPSIAPTVAEAHGLSSGFRRSINPCMIGTKVSLNTLPAITPISKIVSIMLPNISEPPFCQIPFIVSLAFLNIFFTLSQAFWTCSINLSLTLFQAVMIGSKKLSKIPLTLSAMSWNFCGICSNADSV